jgi:hypothetical protein
MGVSNTVVRTDPVDDEGGLARVPGLRAELPARRRRGVSGMPLCPIRPSVGGYEGYEAAREVVHGSVRRRLGGALRGC